MFKRLIASIICLTFSISNLQCANAQGFSINQLPVPGTMVGESVPFAPLALKGLVVNPQKPLEFQFIVDTGHGPQDIASVKDQANQLVKYFLAGLTIPEGDLWVNLSPYEKNRMVPEALGQTDLGRDLLAQDYILKQLTASLIYPEKDLGKEFWSMVYAKAQKHFGTTNVPVNTFNKVWILPDQAQVFENVNAAYVTKSTLKVMLDEDYLALRKHVAPLNGTNSIGSQIVRAIILPEIEKEVNTGKNFVPLRQIYDAMILAKWYKETVQNGLLDALYINKKKTAGVDLTDPAIKEKIYQRYLRAYKKGVFNYIKEDVNVVGQRMPRKYFSGGAVIVIPHLQENGNVTRVHWDGAMIGLTVDLAQSAKVPLSDDLNFKDFRQISESITDYKVDESLGRDLDVLAVVKDDRLSHRYQESPEQRLTSNPGRTSTREYHNGVVFEYSLAQDDISLSNATNIIKTKESTGADFYNHLIAMTNGDSVIIVDQKNQSRRIIHNPKFAHLHDISFSDDGNRLLVASTGYDKIIEIDALTGKVLWEWTGWKNGYNQAKSGKTITDDRSKYSELISQGQDAVLVDNLGAFKGYGIPGKERALHVNTAIYGPNNTVIATFFHRGEVVMIDKNTGNTKVIFSGMKSPHGFYRDPEIGYMVTDTQNGRFLRFDTNNKRVESLSFSELPHELKYRDFPGEWIQFVTKLTTKIYAVVNLRNSVIYLINMDKKTYRTIKIDEDLAIQYIKTIPVGNKAMMGEEEKGGIDLNQINVKHTGKTVTVQFDPAQLSALEQGGFEGFTPVITGFQYIKNPFPLLGINTVLPERLAKI